jgi:thiol-disulfide isomerase/thioredoxin
VEITYQACSARTCLLPAHPVVAANFTIVDAAPATTVVAPSRAKSKVPAAKTNKDCPSSSAPLQDVYDQLRVLQYDDPDSYRRQLECVPTVLASHANRRGEDLYYAGMMAMRHDSYFHKDGNAAKATADLDRFLKTQLPSPHEESALANLVVAEGAIGKLDDAIQHFDQLLTKFRRRGHTHETWSDSTNIEYAGMWLIRSLTEKKRSADNEKVTRELLQYMEERDSEAAWRAASTSSSLFEALEDQGKADEAAAARRELAEHFAIRDKYPASAEMWLANRRIAALEHAGKTAEALALLNQNKEHYAKAGFARIYENDAVRLSLYDSPAPLIQAEEWVNSEPLSLERLRGKVVVLDFWASWCMPCREGFPALIELSTRRGPEGLVVIGVTQNDGWVLTKDGRSIGRGASAKKLDWPEELGLIKQFIRDFNLTMPVAVGKRPVDNKIPFANASMVRDYGVNSFPKGIVIDRTGVVRFVGDPDDSRYMHAIDNALKGQS